MKKWILLVPAAAAAAGAAILLKGKGGEKAAKPAAKGGKKPAAPVMKNPQTGTYSFASGFKDAKTVDVSITYDGENSSFTVSSEDFLSATGDSHVGLLYAPDFAMQIEYAPYYAGEDFEAVKKDVAERFREYGEINFGGVNGVRYFNGKNFCMAFPVEGVTADYVLFNVVCMGDDSEEEAAKLPDNPMVLAVMNSLTVSAQ